MAQPPAELLEGLRLFNEGRYYDAHEAWEERWQEIGDSSAGFWKGLIQIAVAFLHWERGNAAGALKLSRSGRRYLEPFRPRFLGLDLEALLAELERAFAPLEQAARERRPAPPLEEKPRIPLP